MATTKRQLDLTSDFGWAIFDEESEFKEYKLQELPLTETGVDRNLVDETNIQQSRVPSASTMICPPRQ